MATADVVDVGPTEVGGLGIQRLRGFQIVNGGQTTASLYRARKIDKSDLAGILVPAKIIIAQSGQLDAMVVSVSRAANSQNTVQPADFSANNPFHIAVESLANTTWLPDHSGRWFYERARGSYGAAELVAGAHALGRRHNETPKARRFSKTDLAKYLNGWDGLPHAVSRGSQKNYQAFMQALKEDHPDGFVPDRAWYEAFIAKAILFREVQAVIRAQKFPAYKANIAAYTVTLIALKTADVIDFHRIWTQQAISRQMRSLIQDWTPKSTGSCVVLRARGCSVSGQRKQIVGKLCKSCRSNFPIPCPPRF